MWLVLVFMVVIAIAIGVLLSDILLEQAMLQDAPLTGFAAVYLKIYHPITTPALIAGILLAIIWWIGRKF